ncbi:Berberine bridge enzyme-like 15 [Erysiphe neolycopersici]|uniref:Berberine bridge enzyme-like 15 n=1 Tax=Erysiphe neolycopersici TaxID=212602 RepID=A0A420HB74_9PEZI|nr:Berberine bridge enzyme-like 15 [Erysiphe neolycopersici]
MVSSIRLIIGSLTLRFALALIVPRAENVEENIFSCLDQNDVSYINQNSPDWATLSSPYNLRLPYVPKVITIPKVSSEVSASIRCATKFQLKVQAKGGGHSYGSFSSGGKDGSLIISMENFSDIIVDQTTFIAKIGTGQRLGNVALALYSQGKRAIPHGTCSSVGIAGHALHGGYGLSSRNWGLTIDHIVGMNVILADGQEIFASEDSNPDIFFAMRGASDSIGIATYLYFDTEAAPDSVVYFSVNLAPSLEDLKIVTTGFEQIQRTVLESSLISSQITFNFFLDSSGSFSLNGWCMRCDLQIFRSSILPSMLTGFKYLEIRVELQDWIQALTSSTFPDSLSQPLGGYMKKHDTFYAKSLVVPETNPLTSNAIKSFFEYMNNNRGINNWMSIISLYGGHGSAINNPNPRAKSSAYSDRHALWNFQNYGFSLSPPYNEAITPQVQGMNDVIIRAQPDTKFVGYLNYLDPQLSPDEAADQYYGNSTYNRLLGIKNKIDPNFIFWNPQAVGLASYMKSQNLR